MSGLDGVPGSEPTWIC